jgi:hypothetical protein
MFINILTGPRSTAVTSTLALLALTLACCGILFQGAFGIVVGTLGFVLYVVFTGAFFYGIPRTLDNDYQFEVATAGDNENMWLLCGAIIATLAAIASALLFLFASLWWIGFITLIVSAIMYAAVVYVGWEVLKASSLTILGPGRRMAIVILSLVYCILAAVLHRPWAMLYPVLVLAGLGYLLAVRKLRASKTLPTWAERAKSNTMGWLTMAVTTILLVVMIFAIIPGIASTTASIGQQGPTTEPTSTATTANSNPTQTDTSVATSIPTATPTPALPSATLLARQTGQTPANYLQTIAQKVIYSLLRLKEGKYDPNLPVSIIAPGDSFGCTTLRDNRRGQSAGDYTIDGNIKTGDSTHLASAWCPQSNRIVVSQAAVDNAQGNEALAQLVLGPLGYYMLDVEQAPNVAPGYAECYAGHGLAVGGENTVYVDQVLVPALNGMSSNNMDDASQLGTWLGTGDQSQNYQTSCGAQAP